MMLPLQIVLSPLVSEPVMKRLTSQLDVRRIFEEFAISQSASRALSGMMYFVDVCHIYLVPETNYCKHIVDLEPHIEYWIDEQLKSSSFKFYTEKIMFVSPRDNGEWLNEDEILKISSVFKPYDVRLFTFAL